MTNSPHWARRSLTVLVASWYFVMLLVSGVLLLVQQLFAIDPAMISIVQFAPLIAVLIFLAFAPGRLRGVVAARVPHRALSGWWLAAIAVISIYTLMIVAAAVTFDAARAVFPFGSVWMLLFFIALQFAGSFGEEVGWRGFLQPALETRHSRLLACVVVGVLWSVWHIRVFADPLTALTFMLNCIALSIVFGYLVEGNIWQRGLIGGFMHAIVNIALFLAIDPASGTVDAVPLAPVLLAAFAAAYAVRQRINRGRSARADAMMDA